MTRPGALVGFALAVAAGLVWLVVPAITSMAPREDLPPAYAGRINPRSGDLAAAAAGGALFQSNCTSCHGDHADGRGLAATGLNPPPADLRHDPLLPRRSDAYLYYRVSEGKPGTAMPSFRGALSDEERWELVAYLRAMRDADGGAR